MVIRSFSERATTPTIIRLSCRLNLFCAKSKHKIKQAGYGLLYQEVNKLPFAHRDICAHQSITGTTYNVASIIGAARSRRCKIRNSRAYRTEIKTPHTSSPRARKHRRLRIIEIILTSLLPIGSSTQERCQALATPCQRKELKLE